jgi:hypothetical protein
LDPNAISSWTCNNLIISQGELKRNESEFADSTETCFKPVSKYSRLKIYFKRLAKTRTQKKTATANTINYINILIK